MTSTDEELCAQFDAAIAPKDALDRRVLIRALARTRYYASIVDQPEPTKKPTE